MKRLASILLILLFFTVTATAQQQGTRYNSESGRFVVTFPAEPKVTSKDVDSKLGKIKLYSYIAEQSVRAYAVMYNDYNVQGRQVESDTLLSQAQDGMLHGLEDTLKVARQQKIQVGGYPALWYVAENKTQHVVATLIWASPGLYQVFVVAEKDKHDAEASNRFIASFHITRR